MPITRIESLSYGVDDVPSCTRYFEDIGVEKIESGPAGAIFRTPVNQFVHVRRADDPSLPTAPETGPTLREATWGVDTPATLAAIGAELSRDRKVAETPDGRLHARDETGFALAFAVADPAPASPDAPRYNNYQTTRRVNERVAHRDRPKPTRIGHIVYMVKTEERPRAAVFYLDRLGFLLTDRSDFVGDFMRVHGPADHHSLLLMCVRKVVTRFDHAALELPGFDDVLATGAYMQQRGWVKGMGPGRQSLGSHVYWHFENPCGGEIEFFTDMDRFDDSWKPQVWEGRTPGPVWVLGEDPAAMMARPPGAGRAH
jgi:Glyoxalase/Bleomycin resistance protein/Dioxygenase superfamily